MPFGTENLQRVGFLAVVPGLVRKMGEDPDKVLASAGLRADALENPEGVIPYAAMGRLLLAAAERTRCAHFGLLVGEHIATASLGLVGAMMRNAPTLGTALLDFASHQHRNAHGSVVYLLKGEQQAFFGYAVYQSHLEGYSMICDAAAAGGQNLIRELVPQRWREGIEVWLSRGTPLDATPYHRRFGMNVRFNSDRTAVLLPQGLLLSPIKGADSAVRIKIEEQVRTRLHAGSLDLVTQLRRAIRVGLLSGTGSGTKIAAELGIHPRTLHRHLRAAGISFREVLDETRYEAAQQLLANTVLGIAEVGQIIGYSDPSVFTKAFARWAGVNPSEWRANAALP